VQVRACKLFSVFCSFHVTHCIPKNVAHVKYVIILTGALLGEVEVEEAEDVAAVVLRDVRERERGRVDRGYH